MKLRRVFKVYRDLSSKFPRTILFQITLNILDRTKVDELVTADSIKSVQTLSRELRVDVMLLLVLSIPIAIISQDEILLSRFMFYITYFLNPNTLLLFYST